MTEPYDPLAQLDPAPSAFVKETPVGTVIKMILDGPLTETQQRDIHDSSKLLTWEDGNPKMVVVARGHVDGELKSFWAKKPSSMFQAFRDAQKAAGVRMDRGGLLEVAYVGTKPSKVKNNPQKLYQARYTPPAEADVLDDDEPSTTQPVATNPFGDPMGHITPDGTAAQPAKTPAMANPFGN